MDEVLPTPEGVCWAFPESDESVDLHGLAHGAFSHVPSAAAALESVLKASLLHLAGRDVDVGTGWAAASALLLLALCAAAAAGYLLGALSVHALATHGVFGKRAQADQQQPSLLSSAAPSSAGDAALAHAHAVDDTAAATSAGWYVTEDDLEFFLRRVGDGVASDAGSAAGCLATSELLDEQADEPVAWDHLWSREVPGRIKFVACRRKLPNGKTEYKTTTTVPDAHAREFMDLYLDDSFRPQWDGMIGAYSIEETGDFASREAVVRWTRDFPFAFLSSRQYTLAVKMFERGDDLYGITKAIDHPSADADATSSVVSIAVYYSMWRSRTVECPWGTGRPAAETTLLHHEQLKIPENLARFAIRQGMSGFVNKMGEQLPLFIQARRARGIAPDEIDPHAYGSPLNGGGDHTVHRAAAGGTGGPSEQQLPRGLQHASSSQCLRRRSVSAGADRFSGVGARNRESSLMGMAPAVRRSGTGGDVRLHHESSSSGAFRGFAAVALAGGMAIALGGRGGGGGGGGGGSGSGGSGSGGGGGSSARKLQAGAGVAATTGGLRHSSSVASGLAAMARASRRRERSQRWEGVTE